ncbi:UNVERIFIED_CONTAM: hypothetical protein K2H54_050044 [Gekko kuhli]
MEFPLGPLERIQALLHIIFFLLILREEMVLAKPRLPSNPISAYGHPDSSTLPGDLAAKTGKQSRVKLAVSSGSLDAHQRGRGDRYNGRCHQCLLRGCDWSIVALFSAHIH